MMAISHVMTSVAVWSLTAQYTSMEPTAAGMIAVTIGGLLPDIDHPKSWLGRRLFFVSLPLTLIIGHRGLTHSLLAVVILGSLLTMYGAMGSYLVASVWIGYLTHILGDFLTKGGIPVFWPLKRRFSLPVVTTGSAFEFLLVGGLMLLLAYHQTDYWVEQFLTLSQGGLI